MAERFKNKYRVKSIRLEGYDYRNEGLYFATICTNECTKYFGECTDGKMHLNETGSVAEKYWSEIPDHFPNISLDEFVVMPNHVHGIICIDTKIIVESSSVETLHATSLQTSNKNKYFQNISPKAASLATILRSYKSAVSKEVHKLNPEFNWQSRFHDHIIRNVQSFRNIQQYILNNPKNWKEDEYYSLWNS